jgi:hypothetical protein
VCSYLHKSSVGAVSALVMNFRERRTKMRNRQETREQVLARQRREAERQHRADLEKRKQMAEDFFSPKYTPTPASRVGRSLVGVSVSDTAYELHSALTGSSAAREYVDTELAQLVNRHRFGAAQLAAEEVAAAIEELRDKGLLAVNEGAAGRVLNPFTPKFMLEGL